MTSTPEMDAYKREMQPDADPEPMCTSICTYLLEARREIERLKGYERIWNETCAKTAHQGGVE